MSTSRSKNSLGEHKPQGWAAFDQKQRQIQQQGHRPQFFASSNNNNNNNNDDHDPFPPLTTTTTSLDLNRNNVLPATATTGSFSSVLLPDFPPGPNNADDSAMAQAPPDFAFNKLKQLYSGADISLIRDVMHSVNNDTHRAATLLKEILSTENSDYLSNLDDIESEKAENNGFSSESSSDLAADLGNLSSTLEAALSDNSKELNDGQQLPQSAIAAKMKLILGHLKSIPIEPEWEDDDLYSTHRSNAVKTMRLACRHSRQATNAYMRGDHFSAQRASLKAHKEWLDAERLNAEAAKEILSIRNSKNDPWKLDLHGLHAAEAVQALKEHLKKIETQGPMKQPVALEGVKTKNGMVSRSNESFGSMDVEKLDMQRMGFRQRPSSLQVVTGVGNHSRGPAALPTAVKYFLNENRYHFDETRPGVISVFPKFRQRSRSS